MSTGVQRALGLLKTLPRVGLANLRALPGTRNKRKIRRGQHKGKKCGRGNKGQGQRNTLNRIGYEGGQTPFYLVIPKEPYYDGHHVRRQYPPVSLLQIQRLVDVGRLDVTQPIDLTTLCNTGLLKVYPSRNHYGFNLTDEGIDCFDAKINIEVQWTNEQVIAAVEKNGGSIISRFYDLTCVHAMVNPVAFFLRGLPIPRCKLPPQDAIEYYSDPNNRGYMADPNVLRTVRMQLAQKYGYALPDQSKDALYEMLQMRKDPRQIWFGLEPGWVVNMRNKVILKPTSEQLKAYYTS